MTKKSNNGKLDRTVSNEIDPTLNVKEMMNLAVGRLDDLRMADNRRIDDLAIQENGHIKEILGLRAEFSNALTALSAKYSDIIRIQEQERINAIRAVDVAAVSVASEKANQQAIVLANQVSASADTLRQLVATTAAATSQTIQTAMNQMGERLSALEKANYERQGKSTRDDPAMATLLSEVKALAAAKDTTAGRSGLSREMLMAIGVFIGGLVIYLIEHGVHP